MPDPTPPATNTTDTADTTQPTFKLERGADVTFHARRAGGQVSNFAATIKSLARKGDAGETVEFEFEGQTRIAEGIRRGLSHDDAPCWVPR